MGSLLAAYEDDSDEDDAGSGVAGTGVVAGSAALDVAKAGSAAGSSAASASAAARAAGGAPRADGPGVPVVVRQCAWGHWEDFLRPQCRHGLVVGRPPTELLASWPRSLGDYPEAHPPEDPPGCCGPNCSCMDGTRRPSERELRKPWLEDGLPVLGVSPGEAPLSRGAAARRAVEVLAGKAFVITHGRTSGQHFLEARRREDDSVASEAASSRGRHSCATTRRALAELSRKAAMVVGAALDALPLEVGGDVVLEAAGLLAARGATFGGHPPLRLRAAAAGGGTCPVELRCQGRDVAIIDRTGGSAAPGALVDAVALVPEGEARFPLCRVAADGVEDAGARGDAAAELAGLVAALPPGARAPFVAELGRDVWDFGRGEALRGSSFAKWLRAVDVVRLRAASGATAHVAPPDDWERAMEGVREPSSSSTSPPPLAAASGVPSLSRGLAPPGFPPLPLPGAPAAATGTAVGIGDAGGYPFDLTPGARPGLLAGAPPGWPPPCGQTLQMRPLGGQQQGHVVQPPTNRQCFEGQTHKAPPPHQAPPPCPQTATSPQMGGGCAAGTLAAGFGGDGRGCGGDGLFAGDGDIRFCACGDSAPQTAEGRAAAAMQMTTAKRPPPMKAPPPAATRAPPALLSKAPPPLGAGAAACPGPAARGDDLEVFDIAIEAVPSLAAPALPALSSKAAPSLPPSGGRLAGWPAAGAYGEEPEVLDVVVEDIRADEQPLLPDWMSGPPAFPRRLPAPRAASVVADPRLRR